jgi:LITAF-like zinc ribbon domain
MAIPVTCPSCKFEGEAPDETVGQTVLCPDCKCNIPVPSATTERVPDRGQREPPLSERPSRRPRLEDIDDDEDDRPNRRPNRRRSGFGATCRYCGSDAPPRVSSQISVAGWIVFAVLLLSGCWPFFLLGLLIKEDVNYCSDCGARV